MENKQQPNDKRPYIRHSEIPKHHEAFTRTGKPINPEGETEPCYHLTDYELWLEQWEEEGGQVGPHYDS